MLKTEAAPVRKATPAIDANTSVHRIVLDRTVPRSANVRTVVNVIQFQANATARQVSQGLYVPIGVQRVSMESSVGQIVVARMVEAAIHRRVSAVKVAAPLDTMESRAMKSALATTIPPATLLPGIASALVVGLVRLATSHAPMVSSVMAARNIVRFLTQHVIISPESTLADRVT